MPSLHFQQSVQCEAYDWISTSHFAIFSPAFQLHIIYYMFPSLFILAAYTQIWVLLQLATIHIWFCGKNPFDRFSAASPSLSAVADGFRAKSLSTFDSSSKRDKNATPDLRSSSATLLNPFYFAAAECKRSRCKGYIHGGKAPSRLLNVFFHHSSTCIPRWIFFPLSLLRSRPPSISRSAQRT